VAELDSGRGARVRGRQPIEKYPGWEADEFGNLTLDVEIGSDRIRLATDAYDADTQVYTTYIGLRFSANQLGRHDSSRDRP
jgi:hypothetical protein